MIAGSPPEELPPSAPPAEQATAQTDKRIRNILTLTARQALTTLDRIAEETNGGMVNLNAVLEEYGLPRPVFYELLEKRHRLENVLDPDRGIFDHRGRVAPSSAKKRPNATPPKARPKPIPKQRIAPGPARTPPVQEHRTTASGNGYLSAAEALALVEAWKDRFAHDREEWKAALKRAHISQSVFLTLCQFSNRLRTAVRHGLPIFMNGVMNLPIAEHPQAPAPLPHPRTEAPPEPPSPHAPAVAVQPKAEDPPEPPPAVHEVPPAGNPQAEPIDPMLDRERRNRSPAEQWQIYAAVWYLMEIQGLSMKNACALLDVPCTLYYSYSRKFKSAVPSAHTLERGIAFIRQRLGDDIPAALDRLGFGSQNDDHSNESPEEPLEPEELDSEVVHSEVPPGFQPKNIFDAVKYGQFDFVPGNTENYVPTDAPPGTREKVDVMLGRAHRGNPSLFHPRDPRIRGGKSWRQELREAEADGMRK